MATQPLAPVRFRWLFAAGGGVALCGVILRLSARAIARPNNYSYGGDRADTSWAFMEAAYVDLSRLAIGFGLAVVLVGACFVCAVLAARQPPGGKGSAGP